jgi:uncharacterized protein YjbI with pentapeptide repeats
MSTITCTRCSKTMPAAATFCRRCGEPVANARPPAAPRPGGQPTLVATPLPGAFSGTGWQAPLRPSPWKSVGLIGFLILVAVGGLLFVAVGTRTSTTAPPVQAVREVPRRVLPSLPARPSFPARPEFPPLLPLPELTKWVRHLPRDLPDPVPDLDFRGQLLTQGRFWRRPVAGAVFAGAELQQADFEKLDVRNADFRGADLTQANFAGANLAGAKFDEAYLGQTRFVSVDTSAVVDQTRVRDGITEPVPPPPLLAANAGRASFRAARFSQVDLRGLDLAGADFKGAAFSNVEFGGADLSSANFRDSRFGLSDFEGAKLDGADLMGADLSSARHLTEAQLAAARTDRRTRLPR